MTSRISKALVTLAIGFGLAGASVAQAPTWNAEQTAVWKVVSQSWADEAAQNGKWPGSYVDDNVISWSQENPMPIYKDSLIKWTRFNESQGKTIHYDISPAAIAVRGDTAVVNYVATNVTQRGTDKPDRDVNAIIETLVRDGNSWKFLSTSSFSLKK
jgi:hypothetical protein